MSLRFVAKAAGLLLLLLLVSGCVSDSSWWAATCAGCSDEQTANFNELDRTYGRKQQAVKTDEFEAARIDQLGGYAGTHADEKHILSCIRDPDVISENKCSG